MSNSSSLIDQLTATQTGKQTLLTYLFNPLSPAMLWGRQASACVGLTWGYYGGNYQTAAAGAHAIANGTVTLTASTTNYVYADAGTGAVSVNTTGFPAGQIPLYSVVTGATSATSYTDYRSFAPSATGGTLQTVVNDSVAGGVSVLDTTNSTSQNLKLKTLGSGSTSVTVTSGATSITISATAGTVTGGANEGAGVAVLDTTNTTASTLALKSLVSGTNVNIVDGGALGLGVALTGELALVQQNGVAAALNPATLNFTGAFSVTAAGSVANIAQSAGPYGSPDTPPQLASFTQVNVGTSSGQANVTFTQQPYGVTGSMPSAVSGSYSSFGLVKAMPTGGSWKIVLRLKAALTSVGGSPVAGIVLYDGTKMKFWEMSYNGSPRLQVVNMNSVTSLNGAPYNASYGGMPDWLRVRYDGTNWYYESSMDGAIWETHYQEAANSFLTPTQCGIGGYPPGNTTGMSFTAYSYYQGA